ncbi:hypothetical protein ACH3XW_26925 [Acanthocheilonema viteae]
MSGPTWRGCPRCVPSNCLARWRNCTLLSVSDPILSLETASDWCDAFLLGWDGVLLPPWSPWEARHTLRSTTRQPATLHRAWESIRACHTHCCSPLICVWPFCLLLVAIDRSYAVRIWTRQQFPPSSTISIASNCLQETPDEMVDFSLPSLAPLPAVVMFRNE